MPSGDHCWRHVCSACGFIDYYNPRMVSVVKLALQSYGRVNLGSCGLMNEPSCLQVVGCIVEHEGRILLCRRGIQPCIGQWTVPAGFLELAESTAGGPPCGFPTTPNLVRAATSLLLNGANALTTALPS